jgi:hypothetical protein
MNIEPKTYWEERTNVLEGLVNRLAAILAHNLPASEQDIRTVMIQWDKILDDLEKEYGEKK